MASVDNSATESFGARCGCLGCVATPFLCFGLFVVYLFVYVDPGERDALELMDAASSCDVPKAKALLDSGVDPNFCFEAECPMDKAVRSNCLPILKLMLEHGGDLGKPGDDDDYPKVVNTERTKRFIREWDRLHPPR